MLRRIKKSSAKEAEKNTKITAVKEFCETAIKENRELFTGQGQEPGGENSEQFNEFLRAEIERYEKVARAANIPKQ